MPILTFLASSLLAYGASQSLSATAFLDERATGPIVIDSDVPFVTRTVAGTTTLKAGADVAHLMLKGEQLLVMEPGSQASHVTVAGTSRMRATDSKIAILYLDDQGEATLDTVLFEGGGIAGYGKSIQLLLSKSSTLKVRANDVRFYNSDLHGRWRNGLEFTITLGVGSLQQGGYGIADAMPPNIEILPITTPSFACERGNSKVEQLICSNDRLAEQDNSLHDAYRRALQEARNPDAIGATQRGWLASRNRCADEPCLAEHYVRRMTALGFDTGRFPYEFAQTLCEQIIDPAKRTRLLSQTAATDINNDGAAERMEACWSGTMNAPCSEYYDQNDEQIQIEEVGYEWKDYWTFGERWFQYAGKTFRYSSEDDGLKKPAYISYVTPNNREFVVCDFTSTVTSKSMRPGAKICEILADSSSSAQLEEIRFDAQAENPFRAFDRSETSISGPEPIDIDNDGSAQKIAELTYSSGAGRGCDFNYFEVLAADGKSLAPAERRQRVVDLQRIDMDGYWGRSCGSVSNRLLSFEGRIYYEQNVDNNDTYEHWVTTLKNGRVEEVCSFEPVVTTTIKSIH